MDHIKQIPVLFDKALTRSASDSWWAFPCAVLANLYLPWITPYALLTSHRSDWLTRGVALARQRPLRMSTNKVHVSPVVYGLSRAATTASRTLDHGIAPELERA